MNFDKKDLSVGILANNKKLNLKLDIANINGNNGDKINNENHQNSFSDSSYSLQSSSNSRIQQDQPVKEQPKKNDSDEQLKPLDIYEEPDYCVELIRMKEEIKNQKNLKLKPEDLYVDYCNKYSKINLKRVVFNYLGQFNFSAENFSQGLLEYMFEGVQLYNGQILTPSYSEIVENSGEQCIKDKSPNQNLYLQVNTSQLPQNQQEILSNDLMTDSKKEIYENYVTHMQEEHFQSTLPLIETDRECFFEFLYIEGSIVMMLKTWSKISLIKHDDCNQQDQVKRLDSNQSKHYHRRQSIKSIYSIVAPPSTKSQMKENLQKKILENPLLSKLAMENKESFKIKNKESSGYTNDCHFYIKTIKIFDNYHLMREILVEQYIPEEKPTYDGTELFQKKSFDASTVQWRNNLYYFKRIKQTSSDGTEKSLMLHRLIMTLEKDKEFSEEAVWFKDKHGNERVYEIKETLTEQYNAKFLVLIGSTEDHNQQEEQDFIDSQFVVFQQYATYQDVQILQDSRLKEFKICCLKDLDHNITDQVAERKEIGTIENAFVIQNYYSEEQSTIRFILEDSTMMTMLKFNQEKWCEYHFTETDTAKVTPDQEDYCKNQTYESFKFLTSQYIKSRSSPQVQSVVLSDESIQYFTYNDYGKVQLVFPLQFQKMHQLKIIDQINLKTQIKIKQSNDQYVKINQYNPLKNSKVQNTFQKIGNLKKILAIEKDEADMSNLHFFYGEDSSHQQVCIMDPYQLNESVLRFITMKEHMCKGCDNKDMSKKNNKLKIQQNHNKIKQKLQKSVTHKNLHKHRDSIINPDGIGCLYYYYKVKCFQDNETKKILLCDVKEWKMRLRLTTENHFRLVIDTYFMSKNFYLFILALEITDEGDQTKKRVYLFVRKSFQEMYEFFEKDLNAPLVNGQDTVKLLVGVNNLIDVKISNIKSFFQNVSLAKVNESGIYSNRDMYQKQTIDQQTFKIVKLITLDELDDSKIYNFVPFVYLEKDSPVNNCIMVYDIINDCFSKHYPITPDRYNAEFMHIDRRGFKKILFCQTSSLQYDEGIDNERQQQRAKFSLFQFFKEEQGRIRVQDFIIWEDQNFEQIIQLVGLKQILLSNEVLENNIFEEFIEKSKTVCHWEENRIRGCDLMLKSPLKSSNNRGYLLELHDQNSLYIEKPVEVQKKKSSKSYFSSKNIEEAITNKQEPPFTLYRYKSDVVFIGNSIVQLDHIGGDSNKVAMVISAYLRKELIVNNFFTNQEVMYLLQRSNNKCMAMRITDLKYIVLNTFEAIKKKDFFQCQEILQGKSVCDISLTDPRSVSEALQTWPLLKEEERFSKNSCLEYITKNDFYRIKLFKKSGYNFRLSIINYDFNFQGTIQRALESTSTKSISAIMDTIFEHDNSTFYKDKLNMELIHLLTTDKIDISLFFSRHKQEQMVDKNNMLNILCFEQLLTDNDLPPFSTNQSVYHLIEEVSSYSNLEVVVLEQLKKFQSLSLETNSAEQNSFEIEHFYMDFSMVVIGHKLKNLFENNLEQTEFNEQVLAQYLARKNHDELEFYKQPSIQKLIDYQWDLAFRVNVVQFIVYITLYLIPVVKFFLEKDLYSQNIYLLQIAFVPTLFLFAIEITQMKKLGWSYLAGWNITDLGWFVTYVFFYISHVFEIESILKFSTLLKLIIVLLMFSKLLFFIRIFERFGFLVEMIYNCLVDLIPFISCFITFLIFFSICLICLNTEIDSEVDEAQKIGYVAKTVLQAFRTSIGELGMPRYTNIINQPSGFLRNMNIVLIWMIWYIQTFTMLVVMLNFIIAVINSTYERVSQDAIYINYKYKAELNLECYDLLSNLFIPKSFKIIVFSRSKEEQNTLHDPVLVQVQEIKTFIQNQGRKIMKNHQEINEKMKGVKNLQETLNNNMSNEFKDFKGAQQLLNKEFKKTQKQQKINNKKIMNKMNDLMQGISSPVSTNGGEVLKVPKKTLSDQGIDQYGRIIVDSVEESEDM